MPWLLRFGCVWLRKKATKKFNYHRKVFLMGRDGGKCYDEPLAGSVVASAEYVRAQPGALQILPRQDFALCLSYTDVLAFDRAKVRGRHALNLSRVRPLLAKLQLEPSSQVL
jgi:hypothetical protein